MFKVGQNLLMILMLNLLYPAVLGSIFYSVLGNLQSITVGKTEAISLVMMSSVVLFFSIDFLYTSVHEQYNIAEFLADVVVLIAMFNAFDSVNFLVHEPNAVRFCGSLSVTFTVFVIWDIVRRQAIGPMFTKIISFEIFLALAFFTAAYYRLPLVVAATLSVVTSFMMATIFTNFYKDHKVRFAHMLSSRVDLALPSASTEEISTCPPKQEDSLPVEWAAAVTKPPKEEN
jgi:hypothetical protein